jgi:hypothetical protein
MATANVFDELYGYAKATGTPVAPAATSPNVFDSIYGGAGNAENPSAASPPPATSTPNVFDELYSGKSVAAPTQPGLGLSGTSTPFDEMNPPAKQAKSGSSTTLKDYLIAAPKGINALVQGIYSLADTASVVSGRALESIFPSLGHQYSLDEALGKASGTGERPSEVFNKTQEKYLADNSPAMKQKYAELSNADGFINAAKVVLTDPALAVDMLIQSAPSTAGMVGVIRKAASAGGLSAIEAAKAKGIVDQKLLTEIGQKAAIRSGTIASVLTNAGIEGGQSGAQAKQDVLRMSHDDLLKSVDYQNLLSEGHQQDEARNILSDRVASATTAIAGVISGAATALTGAGAFESKIFAGKATGGVKGGIFEFVKNIGKETAEEAVQSGGDQFGQNVAEQQIVAPGIDLMKGVGNQAGAGAAIGAMTGGLFHLAGQKTKMRQTNKTPTKRVTTDSNSTKDPLEELYARQLQNRPWYSTTHPLSPNQWRALNAGSILSGTFPGGMPKVEK